MIATWMIYCAACSVALSLAALLAERVLIAGRAPVRLVWIGAVALSVLVPAVALRFAPRVEPAASLTGPIALTSVDGPVAQTIGAVATTESAVVSSAPRGETVRTESISPSWRDALARADQTLAVIWGTLSLALIVNFVGGVVTLSMLRRTWEPQTVLGVPVFVSEHSGPAVVGVLSPCIVLPRWVLSLDEAQLSLMLRHEQEHRRAGDGRLLTMARLALIAMPWNFALWWQMVRLRVAVEMDCDSRVLQNADARTYGDLLLEVAGARRGPFLREATAFAERATQLERRIRMLPRHRVRTTRLARVASLGIALAAVSIAWVAPRPSVPTHTPVMPPSIASILPSVHDAVPVRDSQVTLPPVATLPSRLTKTSIRPAFIRTSIADSLRSIPVLPDTDTTRWLPRPGAGPALAPQQLDSLFKRLFADISLSADQEAQARQLLRLREQQQTVRRLVGNVRILGNFVKAAQVLTRRDSALRLLLSNDTDRATFDARRTIRGAGGRGRSGGGGFDSLVALPPGTGGRSAGGGRGGRGGGSGDSSGARMGGVGRSGGGARGNIGGTLRGDSVFADFNADFYIDGNLVWRGSDSASIAGLALPVDSARVARQSEAVFHRFFDGLALNAVQDSSARAIITRAQRESMEFTRFVAPTDLRLEVARNHRSQAASDSALLAIITNPADRAKLEARLRTPP